MTSSAHPSSPARTGVACVLLLTLAGSADSPPTVTLTADPPQLAAPGRVVLHWSLRDTTAAYISDVGVVAATGERALSVPATTTYWLVAEGPGGVTWRSVTVTVPGAKGDVAPTDMAYVNQIHDRLDAPSLAAAVDGLRRLMQDALRSRVFGPIADNNMTALSTGLTESAELVAAGDPIIGSRRVSYIVKVYPDDRPGRYAYTIGTAVQFKRRIERNWFWESADSPVQLIQFLQSSCR